MLLRKIVFLDAFNLVLKTRGCEYVFEFQIPKSQQERHQSSLKVSVSNTPSESKKKTLSSARFPKECIKPFSPHADDGRADKLY